MFKLSSVAVIGAGTMGAGIAQWMAQQDVQTTLCDNNPDQAQKALLSIHASWDKLGQKGKLTEAQIQKMKSLLEVKPLLDVSPNTHLVIEAIIENLDIKKSLFKQLAAHFSNQTVLATNTSSFPIHLIAEDLSADVRNRVLGLHFFNPATIMKLVEVISANETSSTTAQDLYQWFEANGKEPALCKDSPGFIVNRVARSFYGEPQRIVGAEDESKIKEVDKILKEVGDFKMGPFELMDLIGVEVNLSVSKSVWEAFNKSERFAPHALQQSIVDQGRYGKKTKHGFYRYE